MQYNYNKAALAKGYKSGLEDTLALSLEQQGVPVEYEKYKIKYKEPETDHTYTPDFKLPNGIIIETKGRFMPADRKKHLLVQAQYPHLDIRFVFTNPNNRISKSSKTTYAAWCEKYGFQYSKKVIPEAWLKESKKKNMKGLIEK